MNYITLPWYHEQSAPGGKQALQAVIEAWGHRGKRKLTGQSDNFLVFMPF
jgi:hypothetical protein